MGLKLYILYFMDPIQDILLNGIPFNQVQLNLGVPDLLKILAKVGCRMFIIFDLPNSLDIRWER